MITMTTVPSRSSMQARKSQGQRTSHRHDANPDEVLRNGLDPLAVVTRPPDNETQSQRTKRVQDEMHARMISEAIDDDIGRSKHAGRKKTVKLLLLGQFATCSL